MPFIPRSPTWPDPRVKPSFGAAGIDWGHPLATGLALCAPLSEFGGRPLDLVRYIASTFTNVPTWGVGRQGTSLNTDPIDVPREIRFSRPPGVLAATPLTVSIICRKKSAAALKNIFNVATTSAGMIICYWWDSGNGMLCQQGDGNINNATELSVNPTITNLHHYHWTWNGNTAVRPKIYIDGINRSANGSNSLGAVLVDSFDLNRGAATFQGDTEYVAAWVWSRELSAADCQVHAAEPYAMLRPTVRVFYSAPPAAATAGSVVSPRSLALLGVGA